MGQLSWAARFKVREPWLPPVMSTVSFPQRGLCGSAKNSSRTGSPVTSVIPGGNHRAVSEKLSSARVTKRASLRCVNPGIALGSITTTGNRFHKAASRTGPATNPPVEKTAAGGSRSSIRKAAHTLNGSSARVTRALRSPTRFSPPISMKSMGKSSAGASLDSRPRRVPIKRTA